MCKDRTGSSSMGGYDFPRHSSTGVTFKKGTWTMDEDQVLVDYVTKHGEGNWSAIPKKTGLLRNGKSCRLRWINQLRPNLRKGAFTLEEERLIVRLQAKFGNKWATMTEYLPGRTDNEIKNFWNSRIRRLRRGGLLPNSRVPCSQALPVNSKPHEIQSSERNLSCVPQFHNSFARKLPDWFPDSLFSANGFLHHLPESNTEVNPMETRDSEFPSIQNQDNYYLPSLPLESFDAFHDSSSPMDNILQRTPSDSGLFGKWLPDFNISKASSDLSIIPPGCSTTGTRTSLNVEQSAVYTFPDELELTEDDIEGLGYFLNSSPDEFLNLNQNRQNDVCANDGSTQNDAAATGSCVPNAWNSMPVQQTIAGWGAQ